MRETERTLCPGKGRKDVGFRVQDSGEFGREPGLAGPGRGGWAVSGARHAAAPERSDKLSRRLSCLANSCWGGIGRWPNPAWNRRRLRPKVRDQIEPKSRGGKLQPPGKESGDPRFSLHLHP